MFAYEAALLPAQGRVDGRVHVHDRFGVQRRNVVRLAHLGDAPVITERNKKSNGVNIRYFGGTYIIIINSFLHPFNECTTARNGHQPPSTGQLARLEINQQIVIFPLPNSLSALLIFIIIKVFPFTHIIILKNIYEIPVVMENF